MNYILKHKGLATICHPLGHINLFFMTVIIKTVPEFIFIPYDADENHTGTFTDVN